MASIKVSQVPVCVCVCVCACCCGPAGQGKISVRLRSLHDALARTRGPLPCSSKQGLPHDHCFGGLTGLMAWLVAHDNCFNGCTGAELEPALLLTDCLACYSGDGF